MTPACLCAWCHPVLCKHEKERDRFNLEEEQVGKVTLLNICMTRVSYLHSLSAFVEKGMGVPCRIEEVLHVSWCGRKDGGGPKEGHACHEGTLENFKRLLSLNRFAARLNRSNMCHGVVERWEVAPKRGMHAMKGLRKISRSCFP